MIGFSAELLARVTPILIYNTIYYSILLKVYFFFFAFNREVFKHALKENSKLRIGSQYVATDPSHSELASLQSLRNKTVAVRSCN
jgi:hypothetical protein